MQVSFKCLKNLLFRKPSLLPLMRLIIKMLSTKSLVRRMKAFGIQQRTMMPNTFFSSYCKDWMASLSLRVAFKMQLYKEHIFCF